MGDKKFKLFEILFIFFLSLFLLFVCFVSEKLFHYALLFVCLTISKNFFIIFTDIIGLSIFWFLTIQLYILPQKKQKRLVFSIFLFSIILPIFASLINFDLDIFFESNMYASIFACIFLCTLLGLLAWASQLKNKLLNSFKEDFGSGASFLLFRLFLYLFLIFIYVNNSNMDNEVLAIMGLEVNFIINNISIVINLIIFIFAEKYLEVFGNLLLSLKKKKEYLALVK
jgi:hypothetical protein